MGEHVSETVTPEPSPDGSGLLYKNGDGGLSYRSADGSDVVIAGPDQAPRRRLRVLHVIVQPVLVWDDGQELTPGPQTAAATLPLSALADVTAALPAEVAQIEAQMLAEGS